MTRMIRLTRTEVYQYEPDFNSDFYASEGIKTIEDALKADKADLDKGEISLLELADEPTSIKDIWEIVDVDEQL